MTSKGLPQQHLLPKSEDKSKRIGSVHNQLDEAKMKYIIAMRKDLCKENICFGDGSLNLKYFNVKKGHYWSKHENARLIEGVIKHGACNFKQIKADYLKEWTETEIRLRICKLLRFYNLKDYNDVKFTSAEHILAEAKKNKEEAHRLDTEDLVNQKKHLKTGHDNIARSRKDQKLVGGIFFNPPPLKDVNKDYDGKKSINTFSSFFAKTEAKKEEGAGVKDEPMATEWSKRGP